MPHPLRVLVVDDDQDTAESSRMMLSAWGYEVASAGDGASALAVAAAFRPDVAFVDVVMRGMDGYEVARRLRGTPALEGTLLVAVSGLSHIDHHAAPLGDFDLYLLKPVAPSELRRLLEVCAAEGRGLVLRGELARGVSRESRRQTADAITGAAILQAHVRTLLVQFGEGEAGQDEQEGG
jgi:CheY-like chemotaxis protein